MLGQSWKRKKDKNTAKKNSVNGVALPGLGASRPTLSSIFSLEKNPTENRLASPRESKFDEDSIEPVGSLGRVKDISRNFEANSNADVPRRSRSPISNQRKEKTFSFRGKNESNDLKLSQTQRDFPRRSRSPISNQRKDNSSNFRGKNESVDSKLSQIQSDFHRGSRSPISSQRKDNASNPRGKNESVDLNLSQSQSKFSLPPEPRPRPPYYGFKATAMRTESSPKSMSRVRSLVLKPSTSSDLLRKLRLSDMSQEDEAFHEMKVQAIDEEQESNFPEMKSPRTPASKKDDANFVRSPIDSTTTFFEKLGNSSTKLFSTGKCRDSHTQELDEMVESFTSIRTRSSGKNSTDSLSDTDYNNLDGLWSEELQDHVDVALQQLQSAVQQSALTSKLLSSFCDIQEEYSNKLNSLMQSSRSWPWQNDKLLNLDSGLKHVESLITEFASMNKKIADSARIIVALKLDIISKEYSSAYEEIIEQKNHIDSSITYRSRLLSKKKQKAQKLLDNLMKKMHNPKPSSVRDKKHYEMVIKTYRTCTLYDKAIENSNRYLESARLKHRPLILKKIQRIEEFRQLLTTKCFEGFRDSLKPMSTFSQDHLNCKNPFRDALKMQKMKEDMKSFVEFCSHKPKTKGPFDEEVFKYDLPVPLEDLRELVDAKERRKLGLGIFDGSNLSQVIKTQMESNPSVLLPLIFVKLRSAIRYLGGYQTEGIFRIAPSKEDLEVLILQIEDQDYTIRDSNPHVPAAALKQWLLSLDEPIIPTHLHSQCTKPESRTKEFVLDLFNELPDENRNLIYGITHICRQVSKNVEVTKMNLHNLAVVFMPSFFGERNANSDEREEMITTLSAAPTDSGSVSKGSLRLAKASKAFRQQSQKKTIPEDLFGNLQAKTAFLEVLFTHLDAPSSNLLSLEYDDQVEADLQYVSPEVLAAEFYENVHL